MPGQIDIDGPGEVGPLASGWTYSVAAMPHSPLQESGTTGQVSFSAPTTPTTALLMFNTAKFSYFTPDRWDEMRVPSSLPDLNGPGNGDGDGTGWGGQPWGEFPWGGSGTPSAPGTPGTPGTPSTPGSGLPDGTWGGGTWGSGTWGTAPTNPNSPDAMPVGDLPGWTQIIAQDFTTPAPLGSFAATYPYWARYDGFLDTSRNTTRPAGQVGTYNSATTTTVHDSLFDGQIFTDANGTPQVFAITPPFQDGTTVSGGQIYGRYSVRFKIDMMAQYKIAWLLWPRDNNSAEGEIDFPEANLDSTIHGYSHEVNGVHSNNAYSFNTQVNAYGDWHITTIEWTPNGLTFYLDGAQVGQYSGTLGLPTTEMKWVLQTETWINSTAPDPATTGHVYVDWVVAYKYTP